MTFTEAEEDECLKRELGFIDAIKIESGSLNKQLSVLSYM